MMLQRRPPLQKVARRMIRGRLMTKPRLRATLRIVLKRSSVSVCECDHSLTIDFFSEPHGRLGNPTSLPGRVEARDSIPVPRVQHRKAPPTHILAADSKFDDVRCARWCLRSARSV